MQEVTTQLGPLIFTSGFLLLFIITNIVFFKKYYVKVKQGTALIVTDMSSKAKVYFTNVMVYPVINTTELTKISVVPLEFHFHDDKSLLTADNKKVELSLTFYLKVNETSEDVLLAAKSVGASKTADKDTINNLFSAKFIETSKVSCRNVEYSSLFDNVEDFRNKVFNYIGDDLYGYALEDVAVNCKITLNLK